MQVTVYNLSGQPAGEMKLTETIFGVPIKPEVVHEAYVAEMNNSREPWADTKNRGEVRGGGRKPWQQKGTGRARHGSIRSPIWKGGGVAFGPLSVRNYKVKINKKVRRLATRMCLTDKVANNLFFVVEHFDFSEPKTKQLAAFLKKLSGVTPSSWLLLTAQRNDKAIKMSRNLPKVAITLADQISVAQLLEKKAVLLDKESVGRLEQIFKP